LRLRLPIELLGDPGVGALLALERRFHTVPREPLPDPADLAFGDSHALGDVPVRPTSFAAILVGHQQHTGIANLPRRSRSTPHQ
jgi:hypothetical protein